MTILDHIVVLEGSDDRPIYLEIYLRLGNLLQFILTGADSSFAISLL